MNTKTRCIIITRIILFLAVGLFTLDVEAQNIVQNGSFESWTASWTGKFGLMLGFDGAADGRNFADISYTGDFAAQTLATTPGQAYQVSFAVSGNSSYPGLSIVQLSWGGSVVGNTTWVSPYTPGNGLNFDWVYGSLDVLATSSSTLISFQRNPASTSSGTWLDAVQAVPVPEPSILCLLSVGALALIVHLRGKVESPNRYSQRGMAVSFPTASGFTSFDRAWLDVRRKATDTVVTGNRL